MFAKWIEYFRDEVDTQLSFIQLTRNILLFVMVINVALLPLVTGLAGETAENPTAFITLLFTLFFLGVSLVHVLRGKVGMAKLVVPLAFVVAITIISLTTNGLKNTSLVGLPVIMTIGAILLGRRSHYLITPLAVLAIILIAVFDLTGKIEYIPSGFDDAIIIPLILVSGSYIVQLLITRLNENILRARENENRFLAENRELEKLRSTLEERVSNRTIELEIANRNNERRARQFQTIAQVARVISNIQELDNLLPTIAKLISEQFGHYHTGIFLVDELKEFAVLSAANSEGGYRMLTRGHKLRVGQTGIVGYVAATGNPRIALDVGLDSVYFDNPDLPNTRSELALPLRIAGKVIGVLDVQSDLENAFREDDAEVLTTLADQVAIAIQNTRTLEEARKSLTEVQSAYGTSVLEAWRVLQPQSIGTGMQWKDASLTRLSDQILDEPTRQAMGTGQTVISRDQDAVLAIPIRLREQVIGVMRLKNNLETRWGEDEVDIA